MNHVLIVDDTPIQLKIIISIMEKHGISVSVASHGQEALDLMDEIKPDLILMDIVMPGMDGFEVCSTLKRDPKFANIPVLFLTAQADDENIMKAFQSGAADYVTKPVNPPELLARVHTHLELSNTILELRKALEEVKRLSGLLRICAYCKSIEKEAKWIQLEDYLATNSDARLTHCICPTCMEQQLQGEI